MIISIPNSPPKHFHHAATLLPPTPIKQNKEEKEVIAEYSLHNQMYICLIHLGTVGYDMVKDISCDMGVSVPDTWIILSCSVEGIWNLLLAKRLGYDRHVNVAMTYFCVGNIQKLKLFEFHEIVWWKYIFQDIVF